jgi:hypothetical protein
MTCRRSFGSRQWIGIGVLLILAGAFVSACKDAGDEPEEVTGPVDDRDELRFPDTPAGQALTAHIEAIGATGPSAESDYQASLQALRQQAAEVVPLLAQAYDDTDRSLYATRWALVETAAELRVAPARDLLIRLATEPVPAAEPGRHDEVSLRNEESVLRMTAIRGLGYLAVEDETASGVLVKLVQSDVPAVREEALRALAGAIVQIRDPDRAARLAKAFPGPYQEFLPVNAGPVPPAGADPGLRPPDRGAGDAPSR